MRLRDTVAKSGGPGTSREVTAADTYRRVRPHLRRIGVTRVADITGLDRVGIPVFNAICPRSRDTVSVYSGKGVTPTAARTSAVMEAVERYHAARPRLPDVVASYHELFTRQRRAIAPADFLLPCAPGYHDRLPIAWSYGHDLVADTPVLVPHHALAYGTAPLPGPGCFTFTTTNGLAAGNSVEEAVCQALTEVIERDAHTLAEVVDRQLPAILDRRLGTDAARRLSSGLPGRRAVDPATLPATAADLVARFTAAGLRLHLTDITSDLGIPTFRAVSSEDLGPGTSAGHHGVGTHPDADVALLRAVTECAQSRAVDIQAMREDISAPDAEVPETMLHVRRATPRQLAGHLPGTGDPLLPFTEIASYPTDDVMSDVSLLLARLRRAGCDRVVAVQLSTAEFPAVVVRVLVPGAESWGIDRGRLGGRAAQAWRRALAAAAAAAASNHPDALIGPNAPNDLDASARPVGSDALKRPVGSDRAEVAR